MLILLALLAGAAAAAWLWGLANRPLPVTAPTEFVVESGSFASMAAQLQEQGILEDAGMFTLLARLQLADKRIKAGSYEIRGPISAQQLLQKLTEGDVTAVTVKIIEGWNWRQLRTALAQHPDLLHDATMLGDAEIAAALQLPVSSLEGQFFPDTYHVSKGDSELRLLGRAHRRLTGKLEAAWAQRDPDLPLENPQQALILASLVEKETGSPADRPLIAGVFINRLRIGMRLQTDPSVIYGLGAQFDGDLRRVHLETDTPYNTYTRNGLTPTPIAFIGEAALKAATRPAQTRALYFVARGDGSSHFSATLDEHNAAVRKYQLNK